jgi:hypothetical protein
MPGFDRSGPMGNGPMSGGAQGFCGSSTNQRGSAGDERGRRAGMGRRRGFGPPVQPISAGQADNERDLLEVQVRELRQSLAIIEQRLDELS